MRNNFEKTQSTTNKGSYFAILLTKYRSIWWIFGPFVAFLIYLPSIFIYFSGEDFVFINFVAKGKNFYETSQNLFYRPLPNLLWQFDHTIYGLTPWGYHLTNLSIHIANVALTGCLAYKLTSSRKVGLLMSLIFALHPIHVEPVVWLAARPDLSATFFFLVSFIAWLSYTKGNNKGKVSFYLLSLIAYTLAIFCKESAVSLPLILMSLSWLDLKPKKIADILKLVVKFSPFIIVILLYLFLRLSILQGIGGYSTDNHALVNTLWNATFGLWLPLLLPLNVESLGIVLSVAVILVLLFVYSYLIINTKRPNTSTKIKICQGLILIYGSIIPALTVAPTLPNLEQSRILYLPSVGFCLLVAIFLDRLFEKGGTFQNTLAQNTHLKDKRQNKYFEFKNSKINRNFIILIVLVYVYCFSINFALVPWWQAGNLLHETFELLDTANLPLQKGDILVFQGLPDNWHGAYIWRNGISDAVVLWIKPPVNVKVNDSKVKLSDNIHKIWYLQYGVNSQNFSPVLNLYITTNP